jgi:hypothetical protein
MNMQRHLLTGLGWLLGFSAACAAGAEISTLQVAEKVLDKGFQIVDLGKYPGILMLHGMSEMAVLCPGKGTKEDYKNYEWLPNDPHAFGPVVLAFTQGYRLGIGTLKGAAAP